MSNNILQFSKEIIKGQIRALVRGSVEEALIEMYLAGVSVRRVEDIIEALWGSRVSAAICPCGASLYGESGAGTVYP